MATKKYEAGGMTDTQTCGGPGKPKCRKKFKSKGKSQETKGSILGTLGAIAGGIGGYAAYKKLKEKKKGGATKYQKGGSAPHGPGSMTKGTVPPMVNEQAKPQKPKPQRTKSQVPKGWENGKTAERSTKRYQIGGAPMAPPMPSPKTYPTGNKGIKATPRPQIGGKGNPGNEGYKPYGPRPSSPADYKAKVIERYGSEEAARAAKAIQQKGGTTKKMKTGGMVNPNAKMQADKTAGSKGVKSGVNPKAAASKVARGRSGGTSTAPKTATPKAKYGMSVKRK
jgi:hypothetical protein